MNLIEFKAIFVSDNLKSFHLKVVVFSYGLHSKIRGKDFNELVALFIH